jgi:hypothetical protein
MGNGRLKRIAALTTLATTSVMVAGVVNVPALAGLPAPTTTTTVPTTTVPSTSVTVPSTPVTPPTTVTTPTVTTPTVKTPTVKTPSGTTSGGSGGTGGGGGSAGTGDGGGGGTIQKLTSDVTGAVGGVTSGGSTSGSTSNTVSGVKGTVGGVAGGGAAGGGGTTAGGTNPALQALSAFDGGGPGGTAGPGGSGSGSGPGGGAFGGPGGRGGGLPPTLSAAGGRRLRAALELLAECMSAIVPIDRQVLSMRAGGAGAAPLSRSQVASQLGVSTRQVRLSERRGLSGLRVAAEQTGCAGPVGGPFAVSRIGPLQLSVLATTSGVLTPATLASADGGSSPYVPARQAQPGAESPLARLTGNGGAGPAWLVVLVTVLLSVSIAGLMRELRHSVGP